MIRLSINMKQSFLVSLEQFNPVVGNPEYNAVRMINKMTQASTHGAVLCIFPETALNGYHSQDLFFNEMLLDKTEKALSLLYYASKQLGVGFLTTVARRNNENSHGHKPLVNQLICYLPQSDFHFSRNKTTLPDYQEFREYRYWEIGNPKDIKPLEIGEYKYGALVCEESWNSPQAFPDASERLYPYDPVDLLHQQGPLLATINTTGSPEWIGKQLIRYHMQSTTARVYGTPQVFVNLVGAQDELIFMGQSFVMNSHGELVLELQSGQEDSHIIDLNNIDDMPIIPKSPTAFGEDELMQQLDNMTKLYLQDYFNKSGMARLNHPSDLHINQELFEDYAYARRIVSAYQDKPVKPAKVVLGLSGGIDSGLVATICARHLGPANVKAVMMPYRLHRYTHEDSIRLASQLSDNLGIELLSIPIIEETVGFYQEQIGFNDGDLTHQNMQARIRAMILWAIANKENRVVINTTNFSEAATGYGTIGGDLLGLPLIASLPKTLVYRYSRWLSAQMTSLTEEMITRRPTAELAEGQYDDIELGKYEDIDPILESLRISRGDLRDTMQRFFPTHGSSLDQQEFMARITKLAGKLLRTTEFKRNYYNRTPQFTPLAWQRWIWPMANAHFDIERYLEEILKS